MNVVSSRMALRKHPLPKPTGQSEDLLQYLVSHLVDCDSVFADEKQRLYALSGLNLSCISASRAVSFFDTRHRVQFQADGTLVPPVDTSAKVRTPLPSIEKALCDPGTKINMQTEDHAEEGSISETSSYSDSEVDTASDSDHQSDCSSVTDDGYLNGNEETGTILWRHVEFYIIRNPVPGRRHILAAIVSILHTKGEGRKFRL